MNIDRLVDAITKSNLCKTESDCNTPCIQETTKGHRKNVYTREEMIEVLEEVIGGYDEMQRGCMSMGKGLWHVDKLSLGVKHAKEIVERFWEEEV
jgi:hypothetical protein